MNFIVEDGTAKADANSYTTVEDADNHIAAHAEASAWAAKTPEQKQALLIRATRAIDAFTNWKGQLVKFDQALQWPRQRVPWEGPIDLVGIPAVQAYRFGEYPSNLIPPQVKAATAEAAVYCMTAGTPGAQWDGAGIKSIGLGQGALDVEFDANSQPAPLPPNVTAGLRLFTTGGGRKGSLPVRRA